MTLYKSDHARDVTSMHGSLRCSAIAKHGGRCGRGAIGGTELCPVHTATDPENTPYGNKLRVNTRALRAFDQQTHKRYKELNKVIGQMEVDGAAPQHIDWLKAISRSLLKTTQLTPADLAETWVEPPRQPSGAPASEAPPPETQSAPASVEGSEKPAPEEPVADPGYYIVRKRASEGSGEFTRFRAYGAMLGLALGEAVGVTLQDKARDTYDPIEDIVGGGPFGVKAGQWASSTSMALALANSLTRCQHFDEEDLVERWSRWQFEGEYSCTGRAEGLCWEVAAALDDYRISGGTEEVSSYRSGNGGVVRAAPVAVRYWNRPRELKHVACRQSRITHAGPEVIDVCAAFTLLVGAAIEGHTRDELLNLELGDLLAVKRITRGGWKGRSRDQILSGNDAVDSFEAALWCIGTTSTFEDAVLLAANLGGDACGTTAMTGQLAGAIYGAGVIPTRWLERLAWRKRIEGVTNRLFNLSLSQGH